MYTEAYLEPSRTSLGETSLQKSQESVIVYDQSRLQEFLIAF